MEPYPQSDAHVPLIGSGPGRLLVRYGPIKNTRRKVGRNVTCPFCGSGKKFKHCHGKAVVDENALYAKRSAGKPHEKPMVMILAPHATLGPIPAEREALE